MHQFRILSATYNDAGTGMDLSAPILDLRHVVKAMSMSASVWIPDLDPKTPPSRSLVLSRGPELGWLTGCITGEGSKAAIFRDSRY